MIRIRIRNTVEKEQEDETGKKVRFKNAYQAS